MKLASPVMRTRRRTIDKKDKRIDKPVKKGTGNQSNERRIAECCYCFFNQHETSDANEAAERSINRRAARYRQAARPLRRQPSATVTVCNENDDTINK